MPLHIGDKKLIPAPIVNINKRMSFASDGSPLNASYDITLDGTLLPHKGSPRSNGWYTAAGDPPDETMASDTDRFNSILRKQEWLREGLSATGWKLSYSPPGLEPVECYPKLTNISFAPGPWVIKCDYNASLETPEINKVNSNSEFVFYASGYQGLNLQSVSDSYSIREREDGSEVLEISRTISAQAGFAYGPSGSIRPWENARSWVRFRRDNVPFTTGFTDIISTTGLVYNSGIAYNLIEEESINQLGGEYSLSQRYLFNKNNYIETRSVNKTFEPNKLGDGGPSVYRFNINGSITGLDVSNNPTNKLANASGYWAQVSGTLGSTVGAIGQPTTTSLDIDYNNGTINYNLQFINNSGTYYRHTYDVSYTQTQDNPTVTINGSIEGYTPDDFYSGDGSNYTKFDNALSGWAATSGIIKTLAFAYPTVVPPSTLFSNLPLNSTVGFNKANGTITYSQTFAYTSGVNTNYQHTYTVELSTDNAPADSTKAGLPCTVSMNGQIIGFASGTNPVTKMDNARTGWNAIKSTLYTLANAEYSLLGSNTPTLGSGFVRKAITTEQAAGRLGYNVTFNNNPPTSSGIVAVEDVTVEDGNQNDLFAIQYIPGRMTGPIIQNIASTTEKRRTINVSLSLYPKGSAPYYYSYSDKSIPAAVASGIVSGLVPAGIRGSGYWFSGDTENWNYRAGFYTRNVSITY